MTTALQMIPTEAHDRRRYIGGSDIAGILGVQPTRWRTALGIWERKTAPDTDEPEAPKETRKRLARGQVVEPLVARMLEVLHGIEGATKGRRYVDGAVPFFAAEIDFEIPYGAVKHLFPFNPAEPYAPDDEVVNVEIKTVHPFAASDWGDEGTDDVPIHYAAQVQWGLGVTRRRLAICAALFGADDLVLYPMVADDEVIAGMRAKAVDFWRDYVTTGNPPPPQTLSDAGKLWPKDDGSDIVATAEVLAAVTTLAGMTSARKSYEHGEEGVSLLLREFMKNATTLTDDADQPIATLKAQKKQSVDVALLKEQFPEAYKACLRTGTTRVLRLTKE